MTEALPDLAELRIDLPFPVSLNTYYKKFRNRLMISEDGRQFRDRVIKIIQNRTKGHRFNDSARLSLSVRLVTPDRRKRDLDNFCGKALQDALQHSGLFKDDSQIDHCNYIRGEVDKEDPRVEVFLVDLGTTTVESKPVDDEHIEIPSDAIYVAMGKLAEVLLENAPTDLMAYDEATHDPEFPRNEFLAFMQLNEQFENSIYDEEDNPLGLGLEPVRKLHTLWREMHEQSLN